MRRAALALGLAACASPPAPTHVVSVVEPAASVRPAPAPVEVAPPPSGPTIRVGMNDTSLCVLHAGRVHCRTRADRHTEGAALLEAPPIEGISGATDLAMAGTHACALLGDGAVACFGDNGQGQLGAGIPDASSVIARRVAGVARARAVAAGPAHTCAIVEGGAVWCWGDNALGQTGHGTFYARDARELVTAHPVPGVTGARALGLAHGVSCAATAGGVWCWGLTHARGQQASHPPALDASFPEVAAFGGGAQGLCFVDPGGHLACKASGWGGTDVARGAGSVQSPRKVGVGSSHACALGADRKVVCWGANYSGQLGFPPDRDGASVDEERATPVVVAGLPPVVDLVVGAYGACALTVGDDL